MDVVRSQLARFRGREVNTSGDSFLAMFDGPQRAIRCAMAIRDAVRALGIEVHIGARVSAHSDGFRRKFVSPATFQRQRWRQPGLVGGRALSRG
jgi:plasmid stabilization system protein ParE